MMKRNGFLCLLVAVSLATSKFWKIDDWNWTERASQQSQLKLSPWRQGVLDIHHLHVGSAVSSFVVTPDGTTILIDAGEIDVGKQRSWWKELGLNLKLVEPYPNATLRVSEWIDQYLTNFWPHKHQDKVLDYLLLTHFHSDHFGAKSSRMPQDDSGKFTLSGIPAIAKAYKIQKLIDRGYPNYDFPKDLATAGDIDIGNYLEFVKAASSSIEFQQFKVGSTDQIQQVHHPEKNDFQIQVLRSSDTVLLKNGTTIHIPGVILDSNGKWNENTMSAAFLIEYGAFRYYEGGDQEVTRKKDGTVLFDTIGPTAKVVGSVDVASLNHHGHGVTKDFVEFVDPDIMILQGWCSDQPPKKSIELLAASHSRNPRQIFATFVFPERLEDLGPSLSKLFASIEGHVVLRVQPPPGQ